MVQKGPKMKYAKDKSRGIVESRLQQSDIFDKSSPKPSVNFIYLLIDCCRMVLKRVDRFL
jgi:hypothetical protein